MRLYCGTSGFSYKAWKGPFYPAGLPAGEMLAYYASRLPAVEINNTFYRLPSASQLERWRDQVPEQFRFAVKASRRITHVKRLRDCEEPAALLFGAVEALGERLGAVLFQLPPTFRADVPRLESFLKLVPAGVPAAFEFRHDSWRDPAVLELLTAHGAAWANVDESGAEPATLPRTAAWTYVRLRAADYSTGALEAWRRACEAFEHAFVFFKHEDEAAGPAFAERMQAL